jgi:hypothetical protein
MSRLEVPIKQRTLYATCDVLLRVELNLAIKNNPGLWKKENFRVDSGTEMTTFPAWLAKMLDLPMPRSPATHATHAQTGLELRSGALRFRVVGMDQTEYALPYLFLGDPNVRPSAGAPAGAIPRNLLQPLQLLDVLRFEMKKDPAAGLAYGMMVVEKV